MLGESARGGEAGGEAGDEGGEGGALAGDSLGGEFAAGGVGELCSHGDGDGVLNGGVVDPGVVVLNDGFDARPAVDIGELLENLFGV